MPAPRLGQPYLGHGIGLRRQHFDAIHDHRADIDFLEILSENFMGFGGRPSDALDRAVAAFPVVLHGVALSIGRADDLDPAYLDALFGLIDRIKPLWFSDHLCFSSAFGVEYHDLIPVPFTEEAVELVATRARALQARGGIPFLIENPSYYIGYAASEMDEATFLREIVERADCGLLLDVNNVYVNAENHGYDARRFIDALPLDRVVQIHMAGHDATGDVIIDTHGAAVTDAVLDLYEYTVARTGPVTTLVEWDHNIPDIDAMVRENDKVRQAAHRAHGVAKVEAA